MAALATQTCFAVIETCLDDRDLHLLLDEGLNEQQRLDRSGHIEQCPACQQRLELLVCEEQEDLPGRPGNPEPQPGMPGDLATFLQDVLSEESLLKLKATDSPRTSPLVGDETQSLANLQHDVEVMPRDTDRWRFRSLIGEGGMAVVFRADDNVLQQSVTVKVLRQRYVGHEAIRLQFLQEADVQSRLNHPGVARIVDSGELPDGRLFTVMEYREGQTLSQRLRLAQPHDTGALLDSFRALCEIVARAHRQGFRHRDLKPANILIDAAGAVTVLDWGLADSWHAPSRYSRDLPQAISNRCHTIVGTPGYIGPELLRGRSLGPTGDVYALGVILAEILLGERLQPDEELALNTDATLRMATDAVSRLKAQGIQGPLIALVKRCLAAHPADRPSDAAELLRHFGLCHAGGDAASRTQMALPPAISRTICTPRRASQRKNSPGSPHQNFCQSLLGRCKNADGGSFNAWKGAITQMPLLH